MNKKGSEKYYIIISLIIGIMIIGISFWFIFQEYFNDDELSWTACKQSILMRSGSPITLLKMIQERLIDLKCKTQVITINFKDARKAEQLITNTMATCWSTYNENLFSWSAVERPNICFHCARIHFNPEVASYYTLDGNTDNRIYLSYALTKTMSNKQQTYQDYLYRISDSSFQVVSDSLNGLPGVDSSYKFPVLVDSKKGDLLITVIIKPEAAFLPGRRIGTTIPWFPSSNTLKCDISPVIPA